MRGPLPANVEGCESFALARQPLIAVLPENHPLNSAGSLSLPGVAFCTLNDVQAVSELVVVQRRFERSNSVCALLDRLRLARESQP